MKKKIIIGSLFTLIFIVGALTKNTYADIGQKDCNVKFIKIQKDIAQYHDDKLKNINKYFTKSGNINNILEYHSVENAYEIGKNIVITKEEVDQYSKFFENLNYNNAHEMAVNYAEQRNALYASAIINGYGVTDEQIYSYLTELKKNLKETITDSEYQEMIKPYGSEQDYWNYEFYVYTMNLPIQNYVSDLERKYKKNHYIYEDSIQQDKKWEEKFEEIKEELVDEQKYVQTQ
ncbi:MAG: hypothetical protein KHY54_06630 [Roseburia sp.]|nr:hypothetical protein [Roseburia sp.]